eukprot:4665776-Prymnesium_polylepis.1
MRESKEHLAQARTMAVGMGSCFHADAFLQVIAKKQFIPIVRACAQRLVRDTDTVQKDGSITADLQAHVVKRKVSANLHPFRAMR